VPGINVEELLQRIFIVEDEMLVAFEMSDLLEDLGFEVVGPSVHLEDAKEAASNERIDVAFLDVNLGQGKTSKPVKDILQERDIPYVFITAYDHSQVDFIDADDRVLNKPVTSPNLLKALKAIIREKQG
jgi:CheY-like chemotaxis protein